MAGESFTTAGCVLGRFGREDVWATLLLRAHVGVIADGGGILVVEVRIVLIGGAGVAGEGGVVSRGDHCGVLSLRAGGGEGQGGD